MAPMIEEARRHMITAYGEGYPQLVAALARFPRAMWSVRTPDDPWSIQEIVVHVTDSEANSYVRCRRCIAEPGTTVMAYDEERWATALAYETQSADDALELFRWLRWRTYQLIRTLPEAVWAHTIQHPENGVMTLEDWLAVYTRHIPDHIAQMERIYAAWQAGADGAPAQSAGV
jgi:hypothetical protein